LKFADMWGRLSVAKPPRDAPGLAAWGGTAVAPCHKGAPCPHASVRRPRALVRAGAVRSCHARCLSAAPLPAHLRLCSSVPPRRRRHRLPSAAEAAAADNTIAEQALCRCSSLPGEQRCPILPPWCCLPPVILTVSSLLVPNQSSAVPPSAAWSTSRTHPSICSSPIPLF
jgi:hypothetical protein